MLKKILGSRALLSFGLIIVLGIVAVIGYQLAKPTPKMESYCALMPDSIGLFEGSAVTIMGIQEGSITRITPDGARARVDFDLPESRKLSPDAGATTISDTLIADRRLAIIGNEATGPSWDAEQCITKTVTPKSLTQTFAAVSNLADELNGSSDPAHPNLIVGGLAAVDKATEGTGKQVNELIHSLGSALNSPDAAIGHLGVVLDALASLVQSASDNWGDIKESVTEMTEGLYLITDVALPPILNVVLKIKDVLPALNDLTVMFGGPLLRRLNSIENLPQMLSAGVAGLREIVDKIPAIVGAFSNAIDPQTQRVSLAYAPPRVAIPAPDAALVCASINALAPGRCADGGSGLVDVQLAQLVLGSVGAR